MPVTILQIAQMLDLSHATVSRVLNDRADRYISEATRRRVWEKARELGYRPNRVARALVTGKTHQIALWMSSLHTAFHAQVIHVVEGQLRESGYQVLIGVLPDDMAQDWQAPWSVDGYLIFEGARYAAALEKPAGPGIQKAVCMGGTDFRAPGLDCVGFDLSGGSREALEHLGSRGCKRIAYVGTAFEEPRLAAYRAFAAEREFTPELIVTKSQSRADVRLAVRERLQQPDAPDGLFCFNDDAALASYRAARDLALAVPEQIAITGCDGIDDTEYLDVPLTTIQLPLEEMCRKAWEFLRSRMEDSERPAQCEVLRPELVIRASSLRTRENDQ